MKRETSASRDMMSANINESVMRDTINRFCVGKKHPLPLCDPMLLLVVNTSPFQRAPLCEILKFRLGFWSVQFGISMNF